MLDHQTNYGNAGPPITLCPENTRDYARKTNNEGNAKKSIQDQHAVNIRTAKKYGLPLTNEGLTSEKPGLGGDLFWAGYNGSGLDGDRTVPEKRRPILTKLMNGVLSGQIKCIIVYTQDRLWRDVGLCKVMIDILAQEGCLLYDKNGLVDIHTPEGRTAVYNNASEAEKVRRKAKVDSERGLGESRGAGFKCVTAGVLGFRDVLGVRGAVRHVPEEQELARRIFRLFDSGDGRVDGQGQLIGPLSKQDIAKLLMAEGYRWMPDMWAKRGVKRQGETEQNIYTCAIGSVLEDGRYQGRQVHGKKEWACFAFLLPPDGHGEDCITGPAVEDLLGPDEEPLGRPVVEPALFERVQRKIISLKRGANATRNSYALGGLIRCGVCGQSMYTGWTQNVIAGVKSSEKCWKKVHWATWCWCTHDLPVIQHPFMDAYINDVLGPLLLAEFRERGAASGYGGLLNEIAAAERVLTEKEREMRKDVPAFLAKCMRENLDLDSAKLMQDDLKADISCLKSHLRGLRDRLILVQTMEPHVNSIADMNEATRRDAIRAVLRWVAVVPSDAPPICNADTAYKWVPNNDAGRVVFLSAWGTMHTAYIYRARVSDKRYRMCKLRPATADECVGSFHDLPDPAAFYAGLERSYRGRQYPYLAQDVAPGYLPGQEPKVAEFVVDGEAFLPDPDTVGAT